MNRRMIQYVSAGVLVVALATAVVLYRRPATPRLPAPAAYPGLPAAFHAALAKEHAALKATGPEPTAIRKLARLYQANRLFAEARACFQILAARPPGLSARDHYFLADIALNEGDLPAAQAELRATLQADPSYLPALSALAAAEFKTGDEAAAARDFTAILAVAPDNPAANIGLARLDLQQGRDAAAIARLEKLIAVHPESTAGAALFAQVLDRRGDAPRAAAMRELSRQSTEAAPADPWLEELLADCYDVQRLSLTFEEYYKTGRMKQAQPLLDRLKELDPTGPITGMFAGVAHANGLEHVTAVREYYESLGRGGDPEKLAPLLVTSLLALNKPDEAAQLMADFHTRLPDSLPIITAYADVAVRQGNDRLAVELLTQLLAKRPYLYSANLSLAKILWPTDQARAVECLLRVAQMFPADVPSRGLLGEYYLAHGEPARAADFLAEAIAHVPAASPVRPGLEALLENASNQAGEAAAEQGRFTEATVHFDRAIAVRPGAARAYAGKANSSVQLKKFRAAAVALAKLAALQPGNPTIFLSLGDVCYQDGAAAEARGHWQQALQLTAPGDGELREALQQRLRGDITADTFK